MRLFTSPEETKVLLGAVTLMKLETRNKEVEETCDKLIARISRCRDLQYPDCGVRPNKKGRG